MPAGRAGGSGPHTPAACRGLPYPTTLSHDPITTPCRFDASAWTLLGAPTVTFTSQDDPTHPFYYVSSHQWDSWNAVQDLFRDYGKGTPLDDAPMYKLRGIETSRFHDSGTSLASWAAGGSVLTTILLDLLP